MRTIVFLLAFVLLVTGCEPSVMTEKASSHSQTDSYNALTSDGTGKDTYERKQLVLDLDEGQNDYMPLAIGNKWRYLLTQTITTQTPNESPTTSYAYGSLEWLVIAASRKNDTTDEFKVRFIQRYPGISTTSGTFRIRRSSTLIYRVFNDRYGEVFSDYMPKTGVADTLDFNRGFFYYTKGVGMCRNTWGYSERRYTQFNDLRLVEYSLKP